MARLCQGCEPCVQCLPNPAAAREGFRSQHFQCPPAFFLARASGQSRPDCLGGSWTTGWGSSLGKFNVPPRLLPAIEPPKTLPVRPAPTEPPKKPSGGRLGQAARGETSEGECRFLKVAPTGWSPAPQRGCAAVVVVPSGGALTSRPGIEGFVAVVNRGN